MATQHGSEIHHGIERRQAKERLVERAPAIKPCRRYTSPVLARRRRILALALRALHVDPAAAPALTGTYPGSQPKNMDPGPDTSGEGPHGSHTSPHPPLPPWRP
jgi:hypothetical protein